MQLIRLFFEIYFNVFVSVNRLGFVILEVLGVEELENGVHG